MPARLAGISSKFHRFVYFEFKIPALGNKMIIYKKFPQAGYINNIRFFCAARRRTKPSQQDGSCPR